jgi:CheY-like chemotaxis protein
MYADQTKFKHILLNLLSNAAKFTENGQVCLEVERKNKDNEDWIFLRVTDNGIGMTAEQQENLFEPFIQGDSSTTRKYGGTGLGLTITKEFTEMMGGSISLESEFGFGSTFTLSLPAIVSQQVIQPSSDELEGDGIVLVIDDDRIVRKLLKNYLSKLGYAVACAPDGKKGISLAHKLRPDAIILDVKMPGVDGWDVLSTLKSNLLLADIPVIMMSVEEHHNKGFALGATDYMVKPVRLEQLTTVLNKFHIGDHSQDLVMVVDDDPYIREVMAENLKNKGLRVFKAENGKVALEHLDKKKPSLILLDLNMPVMNGFEFLSHLRENQKWRSIPVVVLTASHLTSEEQAHLQGYVETIFKKETYNRDELLLQLHNLIADSKQ